MSRGDLLGALLDQESYRRLYQEHMGFHLAVDGLVGMLPGLVAGMAAQALEDEARRIEALQRIEDQPVDIMWEAGAMRLPPEPPTQLQPLPPNQEATTQLQPTPNQEETLEEIQAAYEQGERGVTAPPEAIPEPKAKPAKRVKRAVKKTVSKPVRKPVKKTTVKRRP